jgi:hypothetical protein
MEFAANQKYAWMTNVLSTIIHSNKLTTPFFFSSVEKYFSPRFINMKKYGVSLFILCGNLDWGKIKKKIKKNKKNKKSMEFAE